MAQHLQRGSCTPGINNLSITFSVSPVEKYMGYFKFILSLKDKRVKHTFLKCRLTILMHLPERLQ